MRTEERFYSPMNVPLFSKHLGLFLFVKNACLSFKEHQCVAADITASAY
jgi:hypothetical protein